MEIIDSPLSGGERMKIALRRFWRWWGQDEPRLRGRREVREAAERSRLVPPQLDVRVIGDDGLSVRARPKASMSLRVFRKETGQWSEPVAVEAVDVKARVKE